MATRILLGLLLLLSAMLLLIMAQRPDPPKCVATAAVDRLDGQSTCYPMSDP